MSRTVLVTGSDNDPGEDSNRLVARHDQDRAIIRLVASSVQPTSASLCELRHAFNIAWCITIPLDRALDVTPALAYAQAR
jgi:hypothetical protein